MWKAFFLLLALIGMALADTDEEWEPFRKTGLFPTEGGLWVPPDMEKETVVAYTARLLDGARQGEAKSMATLGRFFFVRGLHERAAEWLEKAAEAGHPGAQFDFGMLRQTGQGVSQDLVEAYKWLWLATWADVPGADPMLAALSAKVSAGQMLVGIRRAAAFQEAHREAAKNGK